MTVQFLVGDCREVLAALPAESVQTCVTSPPYFGLRDYGVSGQMGLEATPDAYVAELVSVFREVRRVLRDDGTLWLNLGDSYATTPRGNRPGDVSTSSLTNPQRQDTVQSRVTDTKSKQASNLGANFAGPNRLRRFEGIKHKDLIGIPWRVAFALQAAGWWLRQDIIWAKPNPMPESVTDRCTKAHEYLFMLSKSARYFYDADAIAEPAIHSGLANQSPSGFKDAVRTFNGKHADKQRGHSRRHAGFNDRWDAMTRTQQTSGLRNKRSVWTVSTKPFKEAHFATFPPDLIEPCVLAGCPEGGTVLDPFGGAGTTALVADRNGRSAVCVELNPTYIEMAERRVAEDRERRAAEAPLDLAAL